MQQFSMKGRRYFLTPVCLVPNGRAHLGHVAGPLLKMDVLRRHLLRCGADVRMISLSDVHEAHVPIRAHEEECAPEQVGNRFHGQIAADLAALRIEYDDLLNPLDPEWSGLYESLNRQFVDSIVAAGNGVVRDEPLPHVASLPDGQPHPSSLQPRIGDPIVSGWLRGCCPACAQPLVGFFCESCGGHFSPSEMEEVDSAHFRAGLEWRDRAGLWLDLADGQDLLLAHLGAIGVRSDFLDMAERYIARKGVSIRLSVPSRWGIELDLPGLPPHEVIWSYSALLIGCHLVAGERYRELTGDEHNPFDMDSGVSCVLSFGIDNAIPFLVGAIGSALAQSRFKPLDGMLVNYFYDLDGSKFSTSRGHVIWGGDAVTLGGAEPDLLRAYLSMRNPEFGRTSFDVDDFLHFHNDLGSKLRVVLPRVAEQAALAKDDDPGVLRYLEQDFAAQAAALSVQTFDLAAAYGIVERWLGRHAAFAATPEGAASWLVGFALLAAPVLPGVAAWAWSRVRESEAVSLDAVQAGPVRPGDELHPVPLRASFLTRAEFNACLPAHLRR